MDGNRFDNWTRKRAKGVSRRSMLKAASVSGFAIALGGQKADAQFDGGGSCTMSFHAETVAGPSQPDRHIGSIVFTVGDDGQFSEAAYQPQSGGSKDLRGQATGRAIDFEIALGTDKVLALAGVGEDPIGECGRISGIFTGPEPGDIGAWFAEPGGGSSGSSGGSTVLAPVATATKTSSNACQSPQVPCGQNCCPSGATCTDSGAGLCQCPDGMEQCGDDCVPSCTGNQTMDSDTCECTGQCTDINGKCSIHADCCSGYCGGGTCFECSGKVCGDFGCVDPNKDSQNCGNCGNTCIYPKVCSGGVCGCAPDTTPCVDHSECCSQLCFVNTCVTCSNVTTGGGVPLTFCAAGVCTNLLTDIDNCGACGNVCPRTSGGIVCCEGTCADINSDFNHCGACFHPCASGKTCHLGDCI